MHYEIDVKCDIWDIWESCKSIALIEHEALTLTMDGTIYFTFQLSVLLIV